MPKDLRRVIEGQHIALAPSEEQMHFYLNEGCGSFAYALWLAHGSPADGTIGLLSNTDGEPWSRSIPFEVTHAYFQVGNISSDVRGMRSVQEMAEELNLGTRYSDKGPYDPKAFRRKFIGNHDRFPLYGGVREIKDALVIVRTYPTFYGLVRDG